MAITVTARMKGFYAFFQEAGASKLANADRGRPLDNPSLYHPTTQIFWFVNSAIGPQDRKSCFAGNFATSWAPLPLASPD